MTDTAAVRRPQQIPAELAAAIDIALEGAIASGWVERIWERDPTVWSTDGRVQKSIADRLGWLDLPWAFGDRVEELGAFATAIREEGFTAAVVCGMGGSSLAPEVIARSLARGETGIPVRILDSTDPTAVGRAATASDPAQTLYLIASKSGTTTESQAFLAHFWKVEDDIHSEIPQGLAGDHFVAITDPGSIHSITHSDLFRETFLNPPDVGGRYSALSYVGLVPAALMAIDLRALLDDAAATADRCRVNDPDNPGLWLGVALGTLARAGRDKLTLVIEPRYAALGAWIEQLVAESTGKGGVGIVPVDGEVLGDPGVYDDDRVFVRISTGADGDWLRSTDAALDALSEAGHPVLNLSMLGGTGALGGEFFRWEFATAVAGAVLGINPFDEPNVTESKDNTKRVLEHFRSSGQLPADEPLAIDGRLTLFGDAPLRLSAGHDGLARELGRHVARCRRRGYIAIQAFIASTPERDAGLRAIAQLLRDRTRRAVTVGYGPRFLHSTGQLHKGGPPLGCFMQITARDGEDVPIHGWRETFGTLIAAQAAGDFAALEAHDLPVARIDLSADVDEGLAELSEQLARALAEPVNQ
jgi:glucose-6-phosphate isomerase